MLSQAPRRVLILVFCLLASSASQLWGNPGFARRYELPCHFCHDGFPKLSILGERFKERGYRLEEEQPFRLKEWLETVPVSVRASVRQSFQEQGDAATTGEFRIMSSGSLGSRVSYWVDQWFSADENGAERVGFRNAFLRVDVLSEEFYVKGGRFELDVPFTQVRSPHLTNYGPYFHNTGFEFEVLGRSQEGLELGGNLDDDTRWSVAVVRGVEPPDSGQKHDLNLNLFGRLQRRYGERRAGVFLFLGENELSRELISADATEPLRWHDDVIRAGADLTWYLRDLHLYGVFLVGRNDNGIASENFPGGTKRALSFASGLLAADYTFRDPLTLSLRLELSRRPEIPLGTKRLGWIDVYPGMKIWLTPQVRLALEFGWRNRERPTIGIVQAEIAF